MESKEVGFMRFLYHTDSNMAGLIARVFIGAVILPHGLPKLLSFEQSVGGLASGVGLPYYIAVLVVIAESVGAVSLIIGFLSRFCALSMIVIMAGAVQLFHFKHGFFMNWKGNQTGEGYEYHLLVVGLALVVVVCGSGRFSIDGLITKLLHRGD